MCRKKRASMYVHGSSTKKKPRNLAFGRMFNEKTLDHFEFHLARSARNATDGHTTAWKFPSYGSPPSFVFLGQQWQKDKNLSEFKNLLIDCFGVRLGKTLSMESIEHALVCVAHNQTQVSLVHYVIET
eukprot:758078-Hanusia_phi.AAC.4